jgi:branched-chain amino acid transport system ATP-binding protein
MPEPLLQVDAIDAFYGDFQALYGVSLRIEAGQVVAIIGANGAGKSTLLRTIAGLMHPRRGRIRFDGQDVTQLPAFKAVKRGIALVPEGRRLFPSLSVEENLQIGAQSKRAGAWTLARV